MNRKKCLMFFVVVAAAALASCSGPKNRCVTNCSVTGDANLSLTMSDSTPANTSILSFTLPISGIALVPSGGGSPVSVFGSQNFELTRLQSDTSLIVANTPVAAGTYTGVNVTVAAPYGVIVNSSTSQVGSCAAGAICSITGAAATIAYTFTTPLTLSANADEWLNLDFNYNNAIVSTSGSINVSQSGVMTASTVVPAGIPTGNFANIDDFTGQVTAVSSSSVTLKSTLRGTLTASLSSTTQVFDPQGQCKTASPTVASCVLKGSIVSLQGLLSTTGVVTATSFDVIDASTTPADEVEGIIYPSSCNGAGSYGMVLSDSLINTSGSPLAGAEFGSGVCLTLSGSASFAIDTGILTGQGVPTSVGFNSASDLIFGQTVRAKITGAAAGTNGFTNATVTALLLRFSRLTGTVGTTLGNGFTITGLPAYLGSFAVAPQVQTYTNATIVEGSGPTAGGAVSMSALFLNPNAGEAYAFQGVKLRTP